MASWVIVTGGGSGIGRALVHHFSKHYQVLTCGRRPDPLQATQRTAPRPTAVHVVACDIATAMGRKAMLEAFLANSRGEDVFPTSSAEGVKRRRTLPTEQPRIELLVQNSAVGDPAGVEEVDIDHLEYAFRVNVAAPLALVQCFLPGLKRAASESMDRGTERPLIAGRILHLGTSVAFHPQSGSSTYGITKLAFHRLYEQLNAEASLQTAGVVAGSMSPGMVDTEGVRDHVQKARVLNLAHVKYFDEAKKNGWYTDMDELMVFVDELLAKRKEDFGSKEWKFSEWKRARM